jgi:hypothetical protein
MIAWKRTSGHMGSGEICAGAIAGVESSRDAVPNPNLHMKADYHILMNREELDK